MRKKADVTADAFVIKGEPTFLREIAGGGLYWPAPPKGRPLSVANGTAFQIREGQRSKSVVSRGTIVDGLVVTESGKTFDHMNTAVLAVLGHEENAFRVVDFLIGDAWICADKLRQARGAFDRSERNAFSFGIAQARHAPCSYWSQPAFLSPESMCWLSSGR